MGAEPGTRIEPAWRELLEALVERPGGGRVGVLGRMGSGKSTLVRWLGQELAERAATGRLDADPGQARIGPPATVALGREPGANDHPEALCFVGAVSPSRHLVDMLGAVGRLARRADQLGLRWLVVDPPGFLDFPAGRAFKLRMVELLDLDHLVVVDGSALAPVLNPLRRRERPEIHEIEPSPAVVERSRADRRAYRAKRFREALKGARTRIVPPDVPLHGHLPEREEDWPGRLVGLQDGEGFLLRLGLAEGIHRGRLRIRARPVSWDRVSSIEVGTGTVRL